MPNRRVFYWFVEAAAPIDPATAPLTLWTNGGPGCSGLFGLLEEMGPFRPTKDGGALAANPYSWNRLSNIVYVEVPVGVGFSYSGDPKDYRTGDQVHRSMNPGRGKGACLFVCLVGRTRCFRSSIHRSMT